MNNLKEKATLAFIWDFLGRFAQSGMGFIISIFLARLIEPAQFGLIAMMMVIITMAQIFTDIGLGGALIQRRRVLPIHYSSVFYFNLFVAILLTILTYLFAPAISEFYHNQALIPLAQVMSFSFILGALSSVQNVKLRKELNIKLMTKTNLTAAFLSGIVGISLAFYGAGVWSLVVQYMLQGVIYNGIIWIKSEWKPTAQFSIKALIQLWGFGFRMFLTGLIDKIFTQFDYMLIGKLFSATQLGFYQRAKSLNLFVVKYTSDSLMSILFPVLSSIQNDLPRFQKVSIKVYGVIAFVTFFLLGGLYITSKELIVLLFGEKWLPSVLFFQILALSGFVRPMGAVLMNILTSRGKSKIVLKMAFYKVIVAFINFYVLYKWGMQAFLYGLIVVSLWDLFLNIVFASKEINVSFFAFAKPFVVQVMIAVFAVIVIQLAIGYLTFMPILLFLIKGILFTLIYFGLSYAAKTSSFVYFEEQVRAIMLKRRQR